MVAVKHMYALVKLWILCAWFGFATTDDENEVETVLHLFETTTSSATVLPTIGNAIDIFANYGDLSQVTQVISSDFDEYSPVFDERSIRIFQNVRYRQTHTNDQVENTLSFLFCDTFEALLENYYKGFSIQGTDKPWKSFMGDWMPEEILRSLGVTYDYTIGMEGYCCFVLTRLSKVHSVVTLEGDEANFTVTDQIKKAVNRMDEDDPADIRRFMTSYGTHYIDSYTTGNSVYQVFVYEEHAYQLLKRRMRHRRSAQMSKHDLRFYTSSFFLKQIGQVMVASGNKTVEKWAEENLQDSQYLYSRSTLLKLYYNSTLLHKLNQLLDNGALLRLKLNIMGPVFKDEAKRSKFVETVDNDLKLWEVTG